MNVKGGQRVPWVHGQYCESLGMVEHISNRIRPLKPGQASTRQSKAAGFAYETSALHTFHITTQRDLWVPCSYTRWPKAWCGIEKAQALFQAAGTVTPHL